MTASQSDRLWKYWIIQCLLIPLIECTNEFDYDVIIMGAGMAGISAAKTLYDAGITNILIIEAQDYIGGRIKTIEFEGQPLNAGASWIHGACIDETNITKCSSNGIPPTEINPMLLLSEDYNISFTLSNYDSEYILDFGGLQHNITNSDKAYDNYYEAQDCINKLINNIRKGKIADMNYFAALYLCNWRNPHSSIEKTVEYYEFTFEYAEKTKFSSTFGSVLDTYILYGDQDLFVTDPKGYQGIILGLAGEFLNIDDLQNEPKIRLNAPITTIKYKKNGVTVTLNEENNNEKLRAKYGIVTFSLGVLQSNVVQFVPDLPKWKRDALMEYNFADYVFIYVKWPYNFWQSQLENITEFILLNDDRFGFFSWIYNLDHPRYFPGSLIWRFDLALDIAALIEYQSINDTITTLIDLKLKHYFVNDLPKPEAVWIGEWASNPYIQGSFSHLIVDFDYDMVDAANWRVENLFFAGEAMDYDNGYVHSAFFSGDIAANEILACMGLFSDDETDGIKCPKKYKPPKNKCDKKENSVEKNDANIVINRAIFSNSDDNRSIGFIQLLDKNKYLLCAIVAGVTLVFNVVVFWLVYLYIYKHSYKKLKEEQVMGGKEVWDDA